MSEQETFVLRLRAARERSGVTLAQIANRTKVPVSVWGAMEENDFSRWPSGVFARAYMRDYAAMCGLDPKETVDEFCRLYPIADRRARPTLERKAEILGVTPSYHDECLPPEGDRRSAAATPAGRRTAVLGDQRTQRAFGALTDVLIVGGISMAATRLSGIDMLNLVAVVALAYFSAGTVLLGRSIGQAAAGLLGRRLPEMLHARERHMEI